MTIERYPVVARALCADYGGRPILRGVDLEISRGEVHVVLGGSGCGKSTLLRALVGLLPPASGEVLLFGQDLYAADEPRREALLRRLGVLFQSAALMSSLSLRDNVALPLRECTKLPPRIIDEIAWMKLEVVGLGDFAHMTPRELSGGMKKRAGLARALALDPDLLLCDEPSAGLDPTTGAELDHLLLSLRDRFGTTIVVVTHELMSINAIADRATMLGEGRVLVSGLLAEVAASDHPVVRAFFGRERRDERDTRASVLSSVSVR